MSTVKDPLDPISSPPPADGVSPEPLAEGETSHSPLLILFGLLVVWGSLYLVAIAQNISYVPPQDAATAAAPSAGSPGAIPSPSIPDSLPVSSMLTPVESLNLREIPARQVVKDLLYKAHLHIDSSELDKIGAEVRNVHFQNKPLYQCLYSTLGEDTLGLLIVDDRVRLIPQQVTEKIPDQGPLDRFHWDADLLLSDRPVSIFPTGRSNLWIHLSLRPSSGSGDGKRRIAFEIFKGSVREGSGEAILPAPGAGALRFVTGSRLGLRIENRGEVGNEEDQPSAEVPIGVRLEYQADELMAEDEPPQAAEAEPQSAGKS